jgi:Protein of unknown function (DUF5663)
LETAISFSTRTLSALPGREAGAPEARDWRLLGLLIWSAHRPGTPGKRGFARTELQRMIGLGSPQELRSALSGVRKILRAVGREDFLEVEGETVLARCERPLDSDLDRMLAACQEADPLTLLTLVGELPYGEYSLEQIGQRLRPRLLAKRESCGWVEEMLGEISAGLERAQNAEEDGEEALEADTRDYLAAYVGRCASIDPRRMARSAAGQDVRLPLEDVYISLVVGPAGEAELAAERELGGAEPDDGRGPASTEQSLFLFEEERDIHFTDLITDSRWNVVLGRPGIGKTTLLQWLALFNARALLAEEPSVLIAGEQLGLEAERVDLGRPRLPILISIAEWAESGEDGELPELADYLGKGRLQGEPLGLEGERCAKLIRRWLAAGRALLLLDGLDEVADAGQRAAIVARVERFVRRHVTDPLIGNAFEPWSEGGASEWWRVRASRPGLSGGNQVFVTSREHGYREAALSGPFQLVQARPLDLGSIERFCRRWCLAVERFHALHLNVGDEEIRDRAARQAERLIEAIRRQPGIRRLVDNPLLLTVLAILQGDGEKARLPGTRLELCEEASRVLVERRRLDWAPGDVNDILGPLALWLQENSPQGHAGIEQVRAQLRIGMARVVAHSDLEGEVEDFLATAQRQSGLLVEIGPGRYGFTHATFREYFAALELAYRPERFGAWLADHASSARWVEVAVLGVAAIAKSSPGGVEEILRSVLEAEPELDGVVHHNLLFVTSALVEAPRSLPTLSTEIVGRLLRGAESARSSGFEASLKELGAALRNLRDARPRNAIPALVAALEEPILAPMATEILAEAPAETPGLLAGLDRACLSAARSAVATATRARVASELLGAGASVDEHLQPLETLLARYPQARTALEGTELGAALERIRERVQPRLHGVLRWLLASVDSDPALADGEALGAFCAKLHESLEDARGADFSGLARLAFDLEPERTRAVLAERLLTGECDLDSAARYLDSHPEALPEQAELPDWLSQLGAAQAGALMRRHHPALETAMVELSWRWLAPDRPREVRLAAAKLLTRSAAEHGWLAASGTSLQTIGAMLEAGQGGDERLALALLSASRVGLGAAARRELEPELASIIEDGSDLRSRAAALMLAELIERPISPEQYTLLGASLAEDEAQRPRLLTVLNQTRREATISDEVLEISSRAAEAAKRRGDPAGADLHANLAMNLLYEEGDRPLAAINSERPWAGRGHLRPAAAAQLLGALGMLDATGVEHALEQLRGAMRDRVPLGLPTAALGALAVEAEEEELRELSATLISGELTLRGDLDQLAEYLPRLRRRGAGLAAVALCTAAHCLPAARIEDHAWAAGRLQAIAEVSMRSSALESSWREAGARLALDVLDAESPQAALYLLGERTTSLEEMADALLYALDTDQNLPGSFEETSSAAHVPAILVFMRLREACATFAGGEREMRALVERAECALGEDSWCRRRAALIALDAAGAARPALFVKCAKPTALRRLVLAAGRDERSYSARRLALAVLSRFRVLDQDALDLISAACRDSRLVSAGIVARCRSFEESAELDIAEILSLLGAQSPNAVEAAAVLLTGLTRAAPRTDSGREQRSAAIAALTTAVRSDRPRLECSVTADKRTLRQALQEHLGTLVRGDPTAAGAEGGSSNLGSAAIGRKWGPAALSPAEAPAAPASTAIAENLRAVAAHHNPEPKGAATIKIGKLTFTAADFGLGQLEPGAQHLLMRATYETLEMRVGAQLAGRFNSNQLGEFDIYFRAKDDDGAFRWLTENAPDYKEIVEREAHSLVDEIRASAEELENLITALLSEDAEGTRSDSMRGTSTA